MSKPLRIHLVQLVTPNIDAYAEFSVASVSNYALRHNYDYSVQREKLVPDMHINWSKIALLQSALQNLDYDVVALFDADLMIINTLHTIELFIVHNPKASIFMPQDTALRNHGRPNAGLIIVRNNETGREIINTWLHAARNEGAHLSDTHPRNQLVYWNYVMPRFKKDQALIPRHYCPKFLFTIPRLDKKIRFAYHVTSSEIWLRRKIMQDLYARFTDSPLKSLSVAQFGFKEKSISFNLLSPEKSSFRKGILYEIFRYIETARKTSSEISFQNVKPSNFIISLTSTPERIRAITPTLNSILNQSISPAKIILWLDGKNKHRFDSTIRAEIFKHPLLEIKWTTNDLGPATKWFYLLEDQNIPDGTPIIVLDDDQIYSRHLIEHYQTWARLMPNCALTLAGWNVPETLSHKDRKLQTAARVRFFKSSTVVRKPLQVDCLQGASSFYFQKGMCHCDVSVFQAIDATRFADDILFSGLLAQAKFPLFVTPAQFHFARLRSPGFKKLTHLSTGPNKDNRHNNFLYSHFSGLWLSRQ